MPKILPHAAMAVGGAVAGYLFQKQKVDAAQSRTEEARVREMRARQEAAQDPLTGLGTRRFFEESYQGLVNNSFRERRRSEAGDTVNRHSLLMLDIDNFRETNNRLGHNEGDALLGGVTSIVMSRIRERDVAARWGGDEILVLLPRVVEPDVALVAEELRASIEKTTHAWASFGVMEIDPHLSMEDNIALVDKALYVAKDAGPVF